MSFDPHAYRVALLEQLTVGSTPPVSPSRPPPAVPPPPAPAAAPSVRQDFSSGTVFDILGTSSAPTPSARAPRGGSGGVVVDYSTVSITDPPLAPHASQTTRHPMNVSAHPSSGIDGLVQSRLHASPMHKVRSSTTAVAVAPDPGRALFSILDESPRSLIADFVDRCLLFGVPDDVIAEHVRFMMYSMKEIVTLHEALHTRYQHDRVRDFELNELTNMVEQQYALATASGGGGGVGGATPTDHGSTNVRRVDGMSPLSESPVHAEHRPHASTNRHVPVSAARPRSPPKTQKRPKPHATLAVGAKLNGSAFLPHDKKTGVRRGQRVPPSPISPYDPYGDSPSSSFSASSSDVDLESLRRERLKKQQQQQQHYQDAHPKRAHTHPHTSTFTPTRGCPCCQPEAPKHATTARSTRPAKRAHAATTAAAVAATAAPTRARAARQRTTQTQPTARPRPSPSGTDAGVPGFMAPTHLSRTREKLIEQDRKAAEAEAALAEALLMEERSPSRGPSAGRSHQEAPMHSASAAIASSSAGRKSPVQWVPPRATRASALRAAYIAQNNASPLHKEDDDDEASDFEIDRDNKDRVVETRSRPGNSLSPNRPAPSPQSSTSSSSSPSHHHHHHHHGGSSRSGSAGAASARSVTAPPPPPPPAAAVASFSLASLHPPSQPPSRRSSADRRDSLPLSPPPRLKFLHEAPPLSVPVERAMVAASAPASATVGRPSWHRARTPTPPVQVTSPRLQVFLERGQQKVREAERVLTQTPPVASLNNSGLGHRSELAGERHRTTSPRRSQPLRLRHSPRKDSRGSGVPSEETFPVHATHPARASVMGQYAAQTLAHSPDRHQTAGHSRIRLVHAMAEDEEDVEMSVVAAGQSPLVMISPTTSSSSNASETEVGAVEGPLVVAESRSPQTAEPRLAADVQWKMLYRTPLADKVSDKV